MDLFTHSGLSINSSFQRSTRIDNEISKERLNEIQKYLFTHQINKNKSFEGKSVEVLVELIILMTVLCQQL